MLITLLQVFAIASLFTAFLCTCFIAVGVVRRPLSMTVMNVVWPVSALFGSVLVLAFYVRYARPQDRSSKFVSITKSCLHCGSGCALGDLLVEGIVGFVPALAIATGWHWLFSDKMFATWVLDTILAFTFGIAFQYFAIAPMRHLGVKDGLKEAIKADIASLAAWQLGMFGVMALAQFIVFPAVTGHRMNFTSPLFWWAMQWAMLGGFLTSFPVNAWLIRAKVKERM
jgi:hypothetical protein